MNETCDWDFKIQKQLNLAFNLIAREILKNTK